MSETISATASTARGRRDRTSTVHVRPLALVFLLASVSPIATARAADWNLYDGGSGGSYLQFYMSKQVPDADDPTKTHTVYYPSPTDSSIGIASSPHLRVQVGGSKTAYFTMDTGSTGIVMRYTDIPNYENLPKIGPGELNYSSSGINNKGFYVKLPVTITGANGAQVTAEVPVLAVTESSCAPNARYCDQSKINSPIFMMGVGFGRETDSQKKGTPDKNPFLNLVLAGTDEKDTAVRPGYVVTRQGVYVGLDAQNTAGDFTYVKLGYDQAFKDWNGAPACITVKGGGTTCGKSLVDTGIIGQMYLQVPTSQLAASGANVANGVTLTFLLPGNDPNDPLKQASYTFKVGDANNPLGPADVIRPKYEGPFVNTSALFLNGFDYLYDYTNGIVGYRLNKLDGSEANVVPKLSLTGPTALPDGFATSLPTVINGGTTIATNGAILFSGVVSGSGGLTIGASGRPLSDFGPQSGYAGAGAVTLSGQNTYRGGTTIAGGTLSVSSDQNLGDASGGITLAGGTLRTTGTVQTARTVTLQNVGVVETQAPTSFTGTVTGNGGLVKSGASSLTLSGTNSYVGPTIVSAGALYVNSALDSSIIVMDGARLGGHGQLGDVEVLSGGQFTPGNSIGKLHVRGNLTYRAGSTHEVEVDASGQSDRTEVGGTATLNGALQVLAQAGTYNPRTRYTILTAAGGVTGQFSDISANYAFLTPSLRYGTNEVDLTLTRNDIAFSAIAQNRNQAALADAIQAAGPIAALYNQTVGLSTQEAQGAFQALVGDIYASAISTEFETAFFVREAILDRLRWDNASGTNYGLLPAAYTADMPGRPVASVPTPIQVIDPRVFGVWGQGFGSFGNARSDGSAASLSRQTSGFVLGADARLENGLRLGVAGGYTVSTLDTVGNLQSANIESAFGGVYGGTAFGPVNLRLGAVYADNAAAIRRSVAFPGFSGAPSARTGGSTVQGFGEVGYRFDLAPGTLVAASAVEPFVGGAYVGIGRDRFTEFGGTAALTGVARDYEVGAATIGVRGQASLDLGLGVPVSAQALIGYRRAFGDVVPTALVAFSTGPGFLTAGLPISRDALVAQAGLDLRVSASTTLGISYTGQVGAQASDHAVKGSFNYRF